MQYSLSVSVPMSELLNPTFHPLTQNLWRDFGSLFGAYGAYGDAIVAGYPVDAKRNEPAPFVYTGTASAFKQVGFKEVKDNAPTRPIFRFVIS